MAGRTRNVLKKDKDIKDVFTDGLIGELSRLNDITAEGLDNAILRDIWIKRPPSVEEFFASEDGWFPEPLWPKQQEFVEAMVGANPLSWNMDYDEGHAFWGKGCVAEDTILKDETTGKTYTIKELAEQGIKIKIKSLQITEGKGKGKFRIVDADTEIPFLKGKTKLYKIKTKSGNMITVSEDHKFYTQNGWKKLKDLEVGDKIFIMVLEFDEIISIKEVGEEDFYDISVPETHCYFAQNILHHNSGKDRTIAKLFTYILVKLLHMRNPQQGMNHFLGGGLGIGAPIDIINVSKDSKQAKNVFFNNLKVVMKNTNNPVTGRNFFEEMGVDLRDAKDIQTDKIFLPHNITCHSLNSKEYAGEGMTTFFAMGDEIGSFPSYEKVSTQLNSIRETITSRFPRIGKMCLISYKYDINCPMTIEYKISEDDPKVFSSKASTWGVNITKKKTDFAKFYRRNMDKAKMTYECEDIEGGGGYIRNKKVILSCISPGHTDSPGGGENPIINNLYSTNNLLMLRFKDWFRGREGAIYCIHGDLSKGKDGGDCAGLMLSHPERLLPKVDESAEKELREMGMYISQAPEPMKGIVIDLAMQIKAPPGGELILADVRKFIVFLKTQLGFNIRYVTFDRWQSTDMIQQLNISGINADELSVDRHEKPYQTVKELLYQGLIRGYENPILRRELAELIKNDKGKIDHPEKSFERLEAEGREDGSKDVSDCLAGTTVTAMEKIPIGSGIHFG